MQETLWFAAGCGITTLAMLYWSRLRSRSPAAAPTISSTEPLVELYAESRRAERLETLATCIGREVADLTSTVEMSAQLLLEQVAGPELPVDPADRLWRAVHRMRFFIHKLLSFAETESTRVGATDVTRVLLDLRKDLAAHSSDGLKIDVVTASALPLAMAEESSLRNALFFLVHALLTLEPNAGSLSLHARTGVDADENPTVRIEIQVESDEGRARPETSSDHLRIDFAAARNLILAQGGTLAVDHTAGLNGTASICLASTSRSLPASYLGPPSASDRHGFGGVLVLEDDPSIRAIISGELKATDRNIFACADGASARSLLSATPERFELLILKGAARLESGDQIALDALAMNPDLKVLLMSTSTHAPPEFPESYLPRLSVLRKPFGLNDLRATLRSLLRTGAPLAHQA